MSRNLAMLLMFVSVVAADVRSAQAQRPPGARENFTVVASGETVILVDQREGRTWLLAHSPTGGTPAWVPIQRFENPEEAEHWREEQRHFAEEREREHREQQEREIRERLEDRRRETMQRREEFEERFRRERERDARERDDRERDDDDRDDDDREWEEQEPQERERPGGAEAPAPDGSGVREHLQRLGQETQRAMMKSLEEHRRRMVEQFGKDHPAVRSIGEQIERLGRKLGEATEAPQPPAKKHDDTKSDAGTPEPQKPPLKKKADPDSGDAKAQTFAAAVRKAYPLLQEELKTLEDTGADEARVKETRHKIEILERLLKQIDEKERRAGSAPKNRQASERERESGTDKEAKSDAKAKDEKGPAQNAKINDIAADLRDLRAQEQLLLQTTGPDHPKVREIRKKIELTKKFLNEFNVQPRNATPADETNRSPDLGEKPHEENPTDSKDESDAATSQHPEGALVSDIRLEIESMKPILKKFPSVADELFPLLIRQVRLVEEYGPEHPDAKEIQNQFERLRSLYQEADIGTALDAGEPAEAR